MTALVKPPTAPPPVPSGHFCGWLLDGTQPLLFGQPLPTPMPPPGLPGKCTTLEGDSTFVASRVLPAKMCLVAWLWPLVLHHCPSVTVGPPSPNFTTRCPSASYRNRVTRPALCASLSQFSSLHTK